jgi:uncharacterized glyoxalase superfamily protein PhnB
MAQPIPEGTPSIVPHLVVRGGGAAIEFYKRAFGSIEIRRMPGPDGQSVMHAELQIGNARFYLADEFPAMGSRSPLALKGSPVTIHLWFADVDSAFARAVRAGARITMPLEDMFWGDRYGQIKDPFGHSWSLATHKEDLTPEQMMQRAATAFPPPPPPARKTAAARPKAKRPAARRAKPKARRVSRKKR